MTAVALLLLAAGYIVAVQAERLPRIGPKRMYRAGTVGLAVVLMARALIGFAAMSRSVMNPVTPKSFRQTIALYPAIELPVLLILGLSAADVALRATHPQSP